MIQVMMRLKYCLRKSGTKVTEAIVNLTVNPTEKEARSLATSGGPEEVVEEDITNTTTTMKTNIMTNPLGATEAEEEASDTILIATPMNLGGGGGVDLLTPLHTRHHQELQQEVMVIRVPNQKLGHPWTKNVWKS